MEITSFDDLLVAARQQGEPQQLLFVFAGAELAEDATERQRADFAAGEGGALVPVMSVDKAAHEIVDFASLVRESEQFGKPWVMVFVAALSGRDGVAPGNADVDKALQRMTDAIKAGSLGAFVPFDRQGQPVQLS